MIFVFLFREGLFKKYIYIQKNYSQKSTFSLKVQKNIIYSLSTFIFTFFVNFYKHKAEINSEFFVKLELLCHFYFSKRENLAPEFIDNTFLNKLQIFQRKILISVRVDTHVTVNFSGKATFQKTIKYFYTLSNVGGVRGVVDPYRMKARNVLRNALKYVQQKTP